MHIHIVYVMEIHNQPNVNNTIDILTLQLLAMLSRQYKIPFKGTRGLVMDLVT